VFALALLTPSMQPTLIIGFLDMHAVCVYCGSPYCTCLDTDEDYVMAAADAKKPTFTLGNFNFQQMTVREFYAAMALPAIIRSADYNYAHGLRDCDAAPGIDEYATDAFRVADAMLAQSAKPPQKKLEGTS
jgi:hypothetical protein